MSMAKFSDYSKQCAGNKLDSSRDDNIIYRNLLSQTAIDSYWQDLLSFYSGLIYDMHVVLRWVQ